jgi:hypothetical protein
MATLNSNKIGHGDNLAPGQTHTFVWNNPPWGRVVSYVAYPNILTEPGSKYGTTSGAVTVARVVFETSVNTSTGNESQAMIDILNCGGETTSWDLYENWID